MINNLLKYYFMNNNLTLGSVESFTGGAFASHITKIPGASNFYKGTIVSYATEIKEKLLGIPAEIIEKHGVVSPEVAALMATKGKEKLNVDVCVSFTGNAGPTSMENKPVGLIYIGIADNNGVKVYDYLLNGSRVEIQLEAISLVEKILLKK